MIWFGYPLPGGAWSGRMGGKASILGNSPLGQVLANLSTYKCMSRTNVIFIVILFGLCIV